MVVMLFVILGLKAALLEVIHKQSTGSPGICFSGSSRLDNGPLNVLSLLLQKNTGFVDVNGSVLLQLQLAADLERHFLLRWE